MAPRRGVLREADDLADHDRGRSRQITGAPGDVGERAGDDGLRPSRPAADHGRRRGRGPTGRGGNFASSMANISFFYPDRKKGWALGLNAAGGNIGVSTVQLLVPILIGCGWVSLYLARPLGAGGLYLQNAGLMWLPLIAIAAFGAHRYMNNLNLTSARSTFRDQLAITGRKHTWVMSWLYIGTFGSFIGYSAAFPLLLKTQFPEISANLAFLGPPRRICSTALDMHGSGLRA
jgi:hypothetical protein